MKISLLCILVGTVVAFSSSVLVNMQKVRLQKLQRQNEQMEKMKTRFSRHIKQYRTKKVFTHQFGLKFIAALAKHIASRRN